MSFFFFPLYFSFFFLDLRERFGGNKKEMRIKTKFGHFFSYGELTFSSYGYSLICDAISHDLAVKNSLRESRSNCETINLNSGVFM